MKDFWKVLICHCVSLGYIGGYAIGASTTVTPVDVPSCILGVIVTVTAVVGAFLCIWASEKDRG